MSFISSSASLTQRRTPSSTRSAITAGVWRWMRIGSDSLASTLAQKSVTATVIRSGASLTPTTRAASGLSCSMTRGRPRLASRKAPSCKVVMRPSSSSAAVIADTVVGLSSVRSEISTRLSGPKRRIASITWKRLIARINSGSAVFMAARRASRAFLRMRRFNFIGAGRCQPVVARKGGNPALTGAASMGIFNLRSVIIRRGLLPEETMSIRTLALGSACLLALVRARLRRHHRHRAARQRQPRRAKPSGIKRPQTTTPRTRA